MVYFNSVGAHVTYCNMCFTSVHNVLCRTHLSIEGGSRLLARAIKGLAAPPLKQFHRHDQSRERGRRGGREEREREGRGRRELAGTRDRKQKTREMHGEWIHTYMYM